MTQRGKAELSYAGKTHTNLKVEIEMELFYFGDCTSHKGYIKPRMTHRCNTVNDDDE